MAEILLPLLVEIERQVMGESFVEWWDVISLMEITETGIESLGTHRLHEMVEVQFFEASEIVKECPSPELFLLAEMVASHQGLLWRLTVQDFWF